MQGLLLIFPLLPAMWALLKPGDTRYLPVLATGISAATALLSLWFALYPSESEIALVWLNTHSLRVDLHWRTDAPARLMGFTVGLINLLVHLFSTGYLHEKRPGKYYGSLGLFVTAMLGIVFTRNLILLFVCWELVGFASWLLIGYWNERSDAGPAARKAFLLNRIGDAGLLSGILLWIYQTGSTDLTSESGTGAALAAALMIAGILGKSAQFPLQSWLPDAMAGPTPASAMIHAATMVAAGVYLSISLVPHLDENARLILSLCGAITALSAACTATVQNDLKKILAYSTLSQLGLMLLAAGIGASTQAFLHLLTHAVFKCGLFLSAGILIHTQAHQHPDWSIRQTQYIPDMRGLALKIRGLKIPLASMLLSLAGLPLTAGGWSKEGMLEQLLDKSTTSWVFALFTAIFLLTSVATAAYVYRLIRCLYTPPATLDSTERTDLRMLIPVWILGLGSWALWCNPLQPWSQHQAWIIDFLAPGITFAGAPFTALVLSLMCLLSGVLLYPWLNINKDLHSHAFQRLLQQYWGWNRLWDQTLPFLLRKTAELASRVDQSLDTLLVTGTARVFSDPRFSVSQCARLLDELFIDRLISAIAGVSLSLGWVLRKTQGGQVQIYLWWTLSLGLGSALLYLFFN